MTNNNYYPIVDFFSPQNIIVTRTHRKPAVSTQNQNFKNHFLTTDKLKKRLQSRSVQLLELTIELLGIVEYEQAVQFNSEKNCKV